MNALYSYFKNIRLTLLHIFIFVLSTTLLFIAPEIWSRYLSILVLTYLYLFYAVSYLVKSFSPATLFGASVETMIQNLISNRKRKKNEFIVTLAQPSKSEVDLPREQQIQAQALRLALVDFTIEYVSNQLNGFRGKRAFLIAQIFGIALFLLISLVYFWFTNFQLFKIDPTNFFVGGQDVFFDFFYYTFKTITFGDVDVIKPISILARIWEMGSFFCLGIVLIVFIMSLVLSLKQEKMTANLNLTKQLCDLENQQIREYALRELNLDITEATKNILKIKNSVEALKKILEKIF